MCTHPCRIEAEAGIIARGRVKLKNLGRIVSHDIPKRKKVWDISLELRLARQKSLVFTNVLTQRYI